MIYVLVLSISASHVAINIAQDWYCVSRSRTCGHASSLFFCPVVHHFLTFFQECWDFQHCGNIYEFQIIFVFLALDLFDLCLLPRKNMKARSWKKTRIATVIRTGAHFASISTAESPPPLPLPNLSP